MIAGCLQQEGRVRSLLSLLILFFFLSACAAGTITHVVTTVSEEESIEAVASTPTLLTPSPTSALPTSEVRLTPATLSTSTPQPATVSTTTVSIPSGQLALVRDDGIHLLIIPEQGSLHQIRLTQGETDNSPQFSPDGQWLLFRRGVQPYLIALPDGESRPVGDNVDDCAWSPRGTRLACNTRDDGLILYLPAEGKTQVGLPSNSGVESVAWSPGGKELAYTKRKGPTEGAPVYEGLWRMKLDGSETSEILANPVPTKESLYLARWTPDGQHILFWQGPWGVTWKDGLPLFRLSVMDGEPTRLPKPMLGYDSFMTASPDGRWMAAVLGGWRDVSANKQIWLLNADGTPESRLSDESRSDLWPAWSPDGERLLYTSLPVPAGYEVMETNDPDVSDRRLWIMEYNGSEKKQLTDDSNYIDEYPLWGKDGRFLIFVRRPIDSNLYGIWAYDLNTHQASPVVQRLSQPAEYYGYINWSAVLDWHAGN